MNVPPVSEPHRILFERPGWCVFLVLASALLSLLAFRLDPVISGDGAVAVHAAQRILEGHWRAGLGIAARPVFSLSVALVSRVTGMSAAHSAYALDAGLFALLVLGLAALVETLAASIPGGGPARWLTTGTVLLFPALNGFRPDVSGNAGYWAFYIWSLAWFMRHTMSPSRRSLSMWLLAGVGALLFSLQELFFLLIPSVWRCAGRAGVPGRARVAKTLVVAAGIAMLVGYVVWRQAWESVPAGELLRHPLPHIAGAWQDTRQSVGFKLDGLRSAFLDRFSRHYDAAALLTTVVLLSIAAVVKALGAVYLTLAGYAWLAARRMLAAAVRYWWGVFLVVGIALLLVPAFTRFRVGPRDAMPVALTILAMVPVGLERLRRFRAGLAPDRRWILPVVLALVLTAGASGLDLGTDQGELRQAGLWLREVADPGSSVYSNSRIVSYYSGLNGFQARSSHSWQETMRTVWGDRWRKYDYLAVVIPHVKAYREGILMRDIRRPPVKVFTNGAGDRVLIFRSRRG